MSLLLNIHTSSETAFVSLTNNETIIGYTDNEIQKEHATFIHTAIKDILVQGGKVFQEIDAIAVTAGPGSYTGIRVGLATAKGLCFALNKPLILLNTLEILARDIINNYPAEDHYLYCPMIDARRMEVYTALYNKQGKEVVPPAAMIIEENSLKKFWKNYKVIVFGTGAEKCKNQPPFHEAVFTQNVNISSAMAMISSEKFAHKAFSDVVFSEPFYLKEFFDNRV